MINRVLSFILLLVVFAGCDVQVRHESKVTIRDVDTQSQRDLSTSRASDIDLINDLISEAEKSGDVPDFFYSTGNVEESAADEEEMPSLFIEILHGKQIQDKKTARVNRVLDANTLDIEEDGWRSFVALDSIAAPAPSEPLYNEAIKAISELVEGKEVELLVTGENLGRTLVFVIVDGINLSEHLVKSGLARKSSDSKSEKLSALEQQARDAKIGIWSK